MNHTHEGGDTFTLGNSFPRQHEGGGGYCIGREDKSQNPQDLVRHTIWTGSNHLYTDALAHKRLYISSFSSNTSVLCGHAIGTLSSPRMKATHSWRDKDHAKLDSAVVKDMPLAYMRSPQIPVHWFLTRAGVVHLSNKNTRYHQTSSAFK